MIEIKLIEPTTKGHEDILIKSEELGIHELADSYYLLLAIENMPNLQLKDALKSLILSGEKRITSSYSSPIYLPIGFYDQGITCLRIISNTTLEISYGISSREGYSIDPLFPDDDFVLNTKDFKSLNTKFLNVDKTIFIQNLKEIWKSFS